MKILVVEDDRILSGLLCTYLQRNNFDCETALDGQSAIQKYESNQFQLILLDLILPIITGQQVLKYIREKDSSTPIIVITSETSQESELTCYKEGTNLFHRKPINSKLLLYQIKSITKEILEANKTLTHKDLKINLIKKSASIKSKKVDFTPSEFKILEYILSNKNRLITKKELSLELYSDCNEEKFSNIDTIFCRIRKKLDNKCINREFNIKTSKGFGYRLL